MAQSGLLGKKSGAGFYKYRDGKKTKPVDMAGDSVGSGPRVDAVRLGDHDELSGVQQRLMFALLNESAKCLHEQIVQEAWMVDLGLVMGTGYAPFRGGPMQTIDDWGVRNCLDVLEYLAKRCGARFTPCALLQELSEHGETIAQAGRAKVPAAAAG
jgi:3-hydroxyacyl-CoA dehydrogenase/enoyl-CoA hydratase/3-hydroxybutyryl-CoA epimerase